MKPVLLSLALSAAVAGTAAAGPPFIRTTMRPHPTAGGFITLTTFHHATQMPLPLTGTAEGLVDGRRTSTALRFDPVAGENGVYVVPRTWEGANGVFVLNVAVPEAHGGAGIVIGVNRTGRPEWQITPRAFEGVTRPATAREVDALLAALEAGQAPPQLSRADILGFATRNPAPFAVLVLLAGGGMLIMSLAIRGVLRLVRRPDAVVAA